MIEYFDLPRFGGTRGQRGNAAGSVVFGSGTAGPSEGFRSPERVVASVFGGLSAARCTRIAEGEIVGAEALTTPVEILGTVAGPYMINPGG